MFARLGRFTHRRSRWVLAAAVLLTLVAGAFGPAVGDAVSGGGFEDPSSESARAAAALEDTFGRAGGDVVLLLSRDDLATDDPAFAEALAARVAELPAEQVTEAVHAWTPGLPPEAQAALLGTDGRTAMVVLTLEGADDDARREAFAAIEEDLVAPAPWTTHVAGAVPVMSEIQHRAEEDIVRAETLAMPVLLVLMAIIFGSLVAAALPVTIGVVAILGAMGLLRLLTTVTDISTFALNVTTILGLGLAIDYALFMVSRFREELGRGQDVGTAVTRTVATAGRTVAFSGLTVLIAFAGLLFFPQMFLRTMGLGGMAVVLLDMVLALTLLPALLSVLGHRVEKGRLPRGLIARLVRRRTPAPGAVVAGAGAGTGAPPRGWARVAAVVLRRPGVVALTAAALLGLIALPALDLRAGQSDVRDLPASSASRQADDVRADLFPGSGDPTLDVVVRGTADVPALAGYLDELAAVPGVTTVAVAGVDPDAAVTHVRVGIEHVVDAPEARDLVADVRALAVPDAADDVLVGGGPAVNVDSIAAITSTLPATLAFVAGVTMVLLFLALGSVVLPVKAVVMNVLSLGATIGVVVWAFGQGHLSGLLSFTETGRIDPANIVLIAVISFGLAMDYELFLLSRIREEHLRGADPASAISVGLQRSGRTITSAALLLVVVLAAMMTSEVTFLQLIGLGLAFAVAVDATVVRAALVPATMRLLGRASWWLPGPLARLHARIGITEDDGDEPVRPSDDGAEGPGREASDRREPVLTGAGV